MQTQNFKYIFVAVLLISVQCTYGFTLFNFGLKDVMKLGKDITTGVAKIASNAISKPNEFFELGKQSLVGYPLEIAVDAMNQMCLAAMSTQSKTPKEMPNINKITFQLMKDCKSYSFPLTEPSKMWQSEHFDPTKKVVMFAPGWSVNNNDSKLVEILKQPYLCRDDINFIVVGAAKFMDAISAWSMSNIEQLGRHIAISLVNLTETVSIENVHLIGHSLGSHIMGTAGRYFTELTNNIVPRITGLDPAKPCFSTKNTLSSLSSDDADFVVIIHSNPGIMAIRDAIGDADFYPGGLSPIAPGTLSFIESHERAVKYYAEGAYPGNENLYLGVSCSSITDLRDGKCNGEKVPMGYATPNTAKGIYFLDINSSSPYGQGISKQEALNNMKCGIC